MAYLAMKWVNDKNNGQLNYVFNYHSIIKLFPGLFLQLFRFLKQDEISQSILVIGTFS